MGRTKTNFPDASNNNYRGAFWLLLVIVLVLGIILVIKIFESKQNTGIPDNFIGSGFSLDGKRLFIFFNASDVKQVFAFRQTNNFLRNESIKVWHEKTK